jgi:hypothetical protein
VDAGLVRRGGGDEDGGSFQLTELGRLATKHIPYFLVIRSIRSSLKTILPNIFPISLFRELGLYRIVKL